jgi:hypothetical protein
MNLFCAGQAAASDGAAFLLTEPSARPAAQGGAYTAARGDLAALHYNPAALAGLGSLQTSFSHMDSLGDWQHDWVAVGLPLGRSALAVDFLWSRVNPFPLYDSNGDQVGTLQAGSETLGLAWGGDLLKGLSAGVSLRAFTTQLAGYGNTGAGLGLGAQYRHESWPLRLGLSLQNAGSQTAYIEQADGLPLLVRSGVEWEALEGKDLGLALRSDYVWHRDPVFPGQFKAGLEAGFRHSLYLEAGGSSTPAGMEASFGLGVEAGIFRVHYAYSPHPVLGSYQRLSFSLTQEPARRQAPARPSTAPSPK